MIKLVDLLKEVILEYNNKNVILYASFLPEQYSEEFKSKGMINKPKQGSNGKVNNKNVILSIHEKGAEFHNFEGRKEYYQIKFEKQLNIYNHES